MKDLQNYCLKNHNTFKIIVNARRFISFENTLEFVSFANNNKDIFKEKFLITGEGSNILYTGDFEGTVIHPETKSLSVISEDKDFILIKADAGIIWDDFVAETMALKAYGLENLSLIPGTIGASVVQNIGAYGAEAGDFVDSVEYLCLQDFVVKTIDKKQCKFAYRNSIFKNDLKNKIIVLSVTYKLSKKTLCNTEYADIQTYCGQDDELTHEKIRNAVIEIRNKKLPDPDSTGNAGSFFKNPIINSESFDKEITISIYKNENLNSFDKRSRRLIINDE
jgi:UDP-N-acetylmuramate dehydrogenase